MSLAQFLGLFPNLGEFSRKSLVLLFAYYLRRYEGSTEVSSLDLRRCFTESGFRVPTDLGALLKGLASGRASPLLKLKDERFALSARGVAEVEAIVPVAATAAVGVGSFLEAAVPHLRRVLAKVSDAQRREFLAEAVSCLGVGAKRSTVVMTWLAVLDHVYEYVIAHHLAAFNAALARRSDRLARLTISSRDGFGEMKEVQFIEICRSAGIVTNDVRKILDEKLGFRNSCAHPSSITIGDSKVVSFIEDLVDNVIAKYPI